MDGEVRIARFDEVGTAPVAPVARLPAMGEPGPASATANLDDVRRDEGSGSPVAGDLGAVEVRSGGPVAGLHDIGAPTCPDPADTVRVARPGACSQEKPLGAAAGADRSGRQRRGPAGERGTEPRTGAGRRRDRPHSPAGGGGRRPPAQVDPDADPETAARDICLRLLTDRARTRQELAQALAQRGIPGDVAGTVLERFDEVGLIDDAAFAGQWVRSRHRHRGLARRAIAMELRRKGVTDDVAGEALAEVDDGSEAARARELVDRRLRSLAVTTPDERAAAARRLVGMLARKGYGAGTAYAAVREALAAHGVDADELGDAEPPG